MQNTSFMPGMNTRIKWNEWTGLCWWQRRPTAAETPKETILGAAGYNYGKRMVPVIIQDIAFERSGGAAVSIAAAAYVPRLAEVGGFRVEMVGAKPVSKDNIELSAEKYRQKLVAMNKFSPEKLALSVERYRRCLEGEMQDAQPIMQVVDTEGHDIPGALFPFVRSNAASSLCQPGPSVSGVGFPVRTHLNEANGINLVAASDVHAAGDKLLRILLAYPNADKVVINGDLVDRGSQPLTVIMALTGIPNLRLNWGNHDAMWFGAGCGNKALVAELVRWLLRYNEEGFIEKMGISLSHLQTLANRNYLHARGSFKSKKSKAMEAAMTAIKLKLEAQKSDGIIQLNDSEKRILEALRHEGAEKNLTTVERMIFSALVRGEPLNADQLKFIDRLKKGDNKLTEEEQAVVEDLTSQFLNSKQFQELTLWFIEQGGMYTISGQKNLYTHSHYPLNPDGTMKPILDIDGRPFYGREAFDMINSQVKEVGAALRLFHGSGDRALLDSPKVRRLVKWMGFLAWDFESPLYGRMMKTWERAYLPESSGTYDEPEDAFSAIVEEAGSDPDKIIFGKQALGRILESFGLDPRKSKLIKGHKPDSKEGKPQIFLNGQVINIDGGMSPAYGGRGLAVIETEDGSLTEVSLSSRRKTMLEEGNNHID